MVQVSAAGEPTDAQCWRFVPLGRGGYRVEHVADGLALTAEERDGEVRMVVALWDGREEQRWQALVGPAHFSG